MALSGPNRTEDYRGLHRDAWFRYALDDPAWIDPEMLSQLQTIKVWIALNVECGLSGLCKEAHNWKSILIIRLSSRMVKKAYCKRVNT